MKTEFRTVDKKPNNIIIPGTAVPRGVHMAILAVSGVGSRLPSGTATRDITKKEKRGTP